jgi:short-chain fatty acids transporter
MGINNHKKDEVSPMAWMTDSRSARFALRCSNFAERWFPDSWVFAAVAVIIVALATLAMGAKPTDAAIGVW